MTGIGTSKPLAVLLVASGLLSGCGDSMLSSRFTVAQTNCNPGVAQLGVADGSLVSYCGCAEGTNLRDEAPANLTCTVAAGTTVFFSYVESILRHQIISTGSPTFVSSPPNRVRNQNNGVLVHAVTFETAGTYTFTDSIFPGLDGQIVVNP